MSGRFAIAALLIGYGPCAVAATQPVLSAEARAIAAQTDMLPPPAPLTDSAVAAVQRPFGEMPLSNLRRGDFVRAIWVDGGSPALQSAEAIRKVVADCRAGGFNTIYVLVRSGGTAACQSALSPRASTVPNGFDPLAAILAEVRGQAEAPLAVHAWLKMAPVGPVSGRGSVAHVAAKHPEWMSADAAGKASGWLDPAVAEVRQHLADVAAEVARLYDVNGVVLQDAGYAPTLDTGYHAAALERFQKETGTLEAPAPHDARWIEWRRTQAAECVRRIRQAVRAVRPQAGVALLSEVDGPAPVDRAAWSGAAAALQRPLDVWPVLAETAEVDSIILAAPQGASVAAEASALEEWTAFALRTKGAARLTVGVQTRPDDAKYTAAMMLDPILEPRADGVAVLPGTQAPSRMEASIFRQLFDPALVEAHARRLVAGAAGGASVARDAGMPRLANREALTLSAGPAPVNAAYLQAADPAASPALPPLPASGAGSPPNAPPPLATPAPIGPDAAALPPVGTPPPLAPDPAATAPAPESAPAPAAAPAMPALPPVAPAAPSADAPPSLPPVTAPAPADGPVPALPPLDSTLSAPPGAGASLPPLAPTEPASALPESAPIPAPAAPVSPALPPSGGFALPPSGGTVSVPSYSDTTNFTGVPMPGPAPVSPTITPPTLRPVEPVPVGAEALPLGRRAAIAAPQFAIPDFSDPHSIFVPKIDPPALRNYAPPAQRPTDVSNPVPPDQLEVIVLNTGKEFAGRVVERGPIYRVQLPNGGIIKLDASRIVTVRAASTPLDVKPLE